MKKRVEAFLSFTVIMADDSLICQKLEINKCNLNLNFVNSEFSKKVRYPKIENKLDEWTQALREAGSWKYDETIYMFQMVVFRWFLSTNHQPIQAIT